MRVASCWPSSTPWRVGIIAARQVAVGPVKIRAAHVLHWSPKVFEQQHLVALALDCSTWPLATCQANCQTSTLAPANRSCMKRIIASR